MEYEKYEHHGTPVWTRKDLKGTHRDSCLCHKCTKFKPGEVCNCPAAQANYEVCVEYDMTTPVYECPEFILAKHIYMICPVRDCDDETATLLREYVDALEKEGHFVHFPPRDVDQADRPGDADAICKAHLEAIANVDEVHAWWDPTSLGSHFDFGMAYMLNWFRPIKFVIVNDPCRTDKRSFTNYFMDLAGADDDRDSGG